MKLTIGMLVLVSSFAFAGKAEREYMKNKVTPAITASTDAVKKACGCGIKFSTTGSIVSEDDMKHAIYIFEDVAKGAAKYCTDADSKKAVCKMKSLKIEKGSETKFAFSGSEGVATHDGQMVPSFDMMTAQLDK